MRVAECSAYCCRRKWGKVGAGGCHFVRDLMSKKESIRRQACDKWRRISCQHNQWIKSLLCKRARRVAEVSADSAECADKFMPAKRWFMAPAVAPRAIDGCQCLVCRTRWRRIWFDFRATWRVMLIDSAHIHTPRYLQAHKLLWKFKIS